MKFDELIALFERTHAELRERAAKSVDTALVVRNWLFGCYMVEYEQSGDDRAEYGAETLIKLSEALTARLGRGFSVDSLELMRRFFIAYRGGLAEDGKSETAFRISEIGTFGSEAGRSPELAQALSAELVSRFRLGWSHYVTLLTINDPDERRFYEIETSANSWSIRELKRGKLTH